MKNEKDATELANLMVAMGKNMNKDVKTKITNMNNH